MDKTIVNLTGSVVVEEIDRLLASYPDDHIYKQSFLTPQAKKKLAILVLSKIPNRYTKMQDEQGRTVYPDFNTCSLEQRLHIELLIEAAMFEMLPSVKNS